MKFYFLEREMFNYSILLKIQNFSELPIINIDAGELLSEDHFIKSQNRLLINNLLWNIGFCKIKQNNKILISCFSRIQGSWIGPLNTKIFHGFKSLRNNIFYIFGNNNFKAHIL